MLGRVRRGKLDANAPKPERSPAPSPRETPLVPRSAAPPPAQIGWDQPANATHASHQPRAPASLSSEILGLLSDPRIDSITAAMTAQKLQTPLHDIETALVAMAQAGQLIESGGATKRYTVPALEKQQLESMFRSAAHELGEHGVLARTTPEDALAPLEDDTEEPRLPVTAGLLSLFLPGTGQLLNGDVGRASLVFAVWSLAWITHLSPVWTFVCLYAGAEAFFTAKIRSMERKLAQEAAARGTNPRALPPPKPQQS